MARLQKLVVMWKDPRKNGGMVKLEIDADKATPEHYEMLDAVAHTVAVALGNMREKRRLDT
jgi:hypothetical protein